MRTCCWKLRTDKHMKTKPKTDTQMPGDGYRWVEEGEVRLPTDELLVSSTGKWEATGIPDEPCCVPYFYRRKTFPVDLSLWSDQRMANTLRRLSIDHWKTEDLAAALLKELKA